MSSRSLLDPFYSPLTWTIGFLQAPLDVVTAATKTWMTEIGRKTRFTKLRGGLPANVHRLEPLTSGITPRKLLVATHNPQWTALFDCGLHGGDPVSSVHHLSRVLRCGGLTTTYIPHNDPGYGLNSFAATQLELFGLGPTDEVESLRSISVTQDGSSWHYEAWGEPQEFEDLREYQKKRIRDRYTLDMLERHALHLGIRLFDENFYTGPSVLRTTREQLPKGCRQLSLTDAQQFHRLR